MLVVVSAEERDTVAAHDDSLYSPKGSPVPLQRRTPGSLSGSSKVPWSKPGRLRMSARRNRRPEGRRAADAVAVRS